MVTNQDIIKASKNFYGGSNPISAEILEFIDKNYKRVEENYAKKNGGNWHKVFPSGRDSKYCCFMIEPEQMLRRNVTFDEFYGGGIVD